MITKNAEMALLRRRSFTSAPDQ